MCCVEEAIANRFESEMSKHKVLCQAFYKGLFSIKRVSILSVEVIPDVLFHDTPHFHNNYLVMFGNGKLKYVHERKIIFEGVN